MLHELCLGSELYLGLDEHWSFSDRFLPGYFLNHSLGGEVVQSKYKCQAQVLAFFLFQLFVNVIALLVFLRSFAVLKFVLKQSSDLYHCDAVDDVITEASLLPSQWINPPSYSLHYHSP